MNISREDFEELRDCKDELIRSMGRDMDNSGSISPSFYVGEAERIQKLNYRLTTILDKIEEKLFGE